MSYRVTSKTGRVRATEVDSVFMPSKPRGSSKYGVILLHGKGVPREWTDGGGGTTSWASAEIGPRLAAAGIPSIAAEMSKDSFGNPASMTDVTAAAALLSSLTGCSTAKYHLFGVSMGGAVALRWAGANAAKVASVGGCMPLPDVKPAYDANTAGLRAAIGTAWGVTYPTAIPAGANLPSGSYPAIVAAGIPVRSYYTSSDTTVLPATVTAAATALGGTAVDVGGSFNHTENTVKLFNDNHFDAYVAWIKGLGA